jgi:hypothetical protein
MKGSPQATAFIYFHQKVFEFLAPASIAVDLQ